MEEMTVDESAVAEAGYKAYSKYFDLTTTVRTVHSGFSTSLKRSEIFRCVLAGFVFYPSQDFVKRVIRALVPVRPLLGNEEDEAENHKPDLYGPIWIPTTLVLSLSLGHSVYVFLKALFHDGRADVIEAPRFKTFWMSAVIIYGYCLIVPASLFIFRLCSSVEVPFFATLCVYGYSMAPIVVAALVSAFPMSIVQWCAMGTGFFLSTMFMFFNIWREQTVSARSLAYFVKLFTGVLHAALGVALTFLFFH